MEWALLESLEKPVRVDEGIWTTGKECMLPVRCFGALRRLLPILTLVELLNTLHAARTVSSNPLLRTTCGTIHSTINMHCKFPSLTHFQYTHTAEGYPLSSAPSYIAHLSTFDSQRTSLSTLSLRTLLTLDLHPLSVYTLRPQNLHCTYYARTPSTHLFSA